MQNIEVTDDFQALHDRVCAGLSTFVEVGECLNKINQGKLYREAGYSTFEEYCEKEHNFSARHGRRIIAASKVEHLAPGINAQAAQTLARVPEEDRAEVIARATDRQGAVPTASMISDMHEEVEAERRDPEEVRRDAIAQTFREVYMAVLDARKKVDALGRVVEGRLLDADNCRVHLTNAMEEIKHGVPKHTCPFCGGAGCKQCKHCGMLSDRLYDLVPLELRRQ